MNVIEVNELTKVYRSAARRRSILALDSASLTVEAGEIFGLLGPNGAGKTTLFKALLGLVSITSGKALINGLTPANPKSRARLGYLPENHRFPAHLTGAALLRLTGRMFGMASGAIEQKIPQLTELVGMDRWTDHRITKYSKGMAQRIGLAQALMPDPEILLLDEPTDGVDPVGKIEIRNVLIRVRDEGKTIILNSHLLSEVESAADRVGILQAGKVKRVASVEELTSRQSQYEVLADMGNHLIDVPPEIGKRVAVTSSNLIVELTEPDNINWVIDQLRAKKISIRAVRPMRVTLEQSFLETVTEDEGKEENP